MCTSLECHPSSENSLVADCYVLPSETTFKHPKLVKMTSLDPLIEAMQTKQTPWVMVLWLQYRDSDMLQMVVSEEPNRLGFSSVCF